jgi:hypothetical protein
MWQFIRYINKWKYAFIYVHILGIYHIIQKLGNMLFNSKKIENDKEEIRRNRRKFVHIFLIFSCCYRWE